MQAGIRQSGRADSVQFNVCAWPESSPLRVPLTQLSTSRHSLLCYFVLRQLLVDPLLKYDSYNFNKISDQTQSIDTMVRNK